MVRHFTLTLIRHMPTEGNRKKQYIGWTDESIMPVNQNFALPWQPRIVYGSDLRRCQESAALYFPNAIYKSDWRLRESFFGDWEGKTYDMLKEDKRYRKWIEEPTVKKPPNGESLQEVETRVMAALGQLPGDSSSHFIVTHGGPIRILLTRFSPEEQDFWSWEIPHQSVWQFVWENEQAFKERKRCVSLSAVPIMGKKLL